MSKIECNTCNKKFKRKENLDYHIEHKACKTYSHRCKYCDVGFTTATSMYRHIKKSCTVKKKEEEQNSIILDRLNKLEQENENLKQKMSKMEKKSVDISVETNNGLINTGTINNNITIVAYGKEDMSYIDRNDIIRALKTGFNSTKLLTEVIHFNPKYPNYSNIKRSNYNMKNKIMYYNGTSWVTTSDPHMIDDLYNRKRDFIEENIEHYQDGLTKGDMTRLQRWLDVDDDDQRITRIKTDLREMLFNKKHVAETNESNSTVQFVTIEELESIDKKVIKKPKSDGECKKSIIVCKKTVAKCKKMKLAGRPGTKHKSARIVRNR
jgi:hypothetical protein